MSKIIEKEVKYHITDPIALIDKLKEQNAIFSGYHLERTIRVDKPGWELSNAGTFIRLRSGFKNTLTLKEARKKESEVSERMEIEVEIDDVGLCQKLLQEIGLTESLIMEKYRMLWKIKDTLITIDELPFGIYAEIEGSIQSIKVISELLGLKYEERIIITYWEIYEELMKASHQKEYDPNIVFQPDYVSKLLADE